MGKSTISMAIFNGKLLVHQRVHLHEHLGTPKNLLISRYAVSAMFMATNIIPFWLTTGPMQLAECDKLDQEALAEAHPVDPG